MFLYEWTALILCSIFLVFCLLWLTHHDTASPGWQVRTERFDLPAAESSSSDVQPDGLLPGEIIDLNTATRSDLLRLPNIGAARAAAILAYRDEHGSFHSVDELLNVHGIGPATLDPLRPFLTAQ